MALHRGDPGRRGCSRLGRARLVQRVHVPIELRRVVGYLDLDVAGIDLRLALEGVLDNGLDLLRAHRGLDRDEVRHAYDSPDVADHPLDFAPLVLVLDFAFERDPPGRYPGVDLALGDLHVPLQDVRDGPGDVGVVLWRAGQLDLQFVSHRLDPVNPLRGLRSGQPLRVGRDVTGQGYRSVGDRDADGVRVGYLRVPLQFLDDVIPDLTVGFHQFTLLLARSGSPLSLRRGVPGHITRLGNGRGQRGEHHQVRPHVPHVMVPV